MSLDKEPGYTKSLFQPLAWRAKEAHAFLKSVALIEAAGVMVRVPNWWTPKNPPRPLKSISLLAMPRPVLLAWMLF